MHAWKEKACSWLELPQVVLALFMVVFLWHSILLQQVADQIRGQECKVTFLTR